MNSRSKAFVVLAAASALAFLGVVEYAVWFFTPADGYGFTIVGKLVVQSFIVFALAILGLLLSLK